MDIGIDVPRFTFVSRAMPEETFSVVRFFGHEGLSRLYELTVELVCEQRDVDIARVLHNPACFTIKRDKGDLPYHGILQRFGQHHEFDGLYFYRAVLAPRLWWLTLTQRQTVFLDKDIRDILLAVLTAGGLPSNAVDFRLFESYPTRDYVCQYGESDFAFFSRWIEHYGMYFFFEQTPAGEKLVITDTRIAHVPLAGESRVEYVQPSALEGDPLREVLYDFRMRRELTPKTVSVRDYNYRTPGLELSARADIGQYGAGETYLFGQHCRTQSESRTLAGLRTQELSCRACRVAGKSFAPFLRPGYTFELKGHPRSDFNQEYLTVDIEHHGYQSRYGTAGLGLRPVPGQEESLYRNEFSAIPSRTQFRSPVRTPRAVIHGTLNGMIDAGGSGTYAELDDDGRYKISLPFDPESRTAGKASSYVRMAQPSGGAGFGMHFPLHKGTEVAVTFVDGNPDRPIISGAAPNPTKPSPVTSATQTSCRLTTAGGNLMHIENQKGSERMLFSNKLGDYLRIGAFNDPNAWDKMKSFFDSYFSKDGIVLYSPDNHWITITCKHAWTTILGEKMYINLGWESQFYGVSWDIHFLALHLAFITGPSKIVSYLSDEKAIPVTQYVHSVRNEVEGQKARMDVSSVKTTLNTVQTTGQTTQSALNNTRVAMSKAGLAGEKTTLAANHNQMSQLHNTVDGTSTQLSQEQSTLALAQQQLAGQGALLTQSQIQSTVSLTKMATKRSVTAMQSVKVAGSTMSMAQQELDTALSHMTQ